MAQPFRKLLVLTALSISTVAALALVRPHVAGPATHWSGDDLALVTAWLLALMLSAWLTLVCSAGSVALVRRDRRSAIRVARFAPAFVRRVVEAAVVVMCAVGPATAAHASPAPPRPPVVVHVNADGTIELGRDGVRHADSSRPHAPIADQPVVRAPTPTTPTTTPRPPRTTAVPVERALASRPANTRSPRQPHADVTTPHPATSLAGTHHVVQHGENLWNIARATLVTAGHHAVSSEQVAPYWRSVVAANRTTLRSGNPSLIFAGEMVTLPPVPAA
jgi:nucleoid-associated protein YgaU